jgi:hypothetical protein
MLTFETWFYQHHVQRLFYLNYEPYEVASVYLTTNFSAKNFVILPHRQREAFFIS